MSDFEADTENDGTVHITPPYPEATGWRIKCADIGNAEYCAAKLNSLFAQLRADLARVTGERDRWEEINRDEIGETLRLMTALDVLDDVRNGMSCMDAMLAKIEKLKQPTPPTGG